MCFDFLYTLFSETLLILRRFEREIIKNVYFLHVKYSLFLFIFMRLEFSRQILEKYSNIRFNEYLSGGIRVVPRGRTDGRTDRQTEMKKLIVAFRNFANAPKTSGRQ
jgi:hypothetical protein